MINISFLSLNKRAGEGLITPHYQNREKRYLPFQQNLVFALFLSVLNCHFQYAINSRSRLLHHEQYSLLCVICWSYTCNVSKREHLFCINNSAFAHQCMTQFCFQCSMLDSVCTLAFFICTNYGLYTLLYNTGKSQPCFDDT